jgi:hypothetical protein
VVRFEGLFRMAITITKREDIIVYYYRLNDSLDIKDVGSVILIIWVKNDGLVEDFIVQEIDG